MRFSAGYFGDPFLSDFVGMNDVFLSYRDLLLYNLGCMGDPFLRDFVGMNDVFLSYRDLLLYNLGCMAEGAFDVFSHVAIPSVTNDAASDKAADAEAAGSQKDAEEFCSC